MRYYMVVIADIPAFTAPVMEYTRRVIELVERHGGAYVMRGGPLELLEGEWPAQQRLVVSSWPSREALHAFWHSDEYQQVVKPIRAGTGQYHVAVFPALE